MSKHLLCRCLFKLNFCIERAPQIFISHLFIVGVYLFFFHFIAIATLATRTS